MLINGRQYEFADISVVMGGRDITGLRGIKYSTKQEKEVLYGKGNKPISVQKGNYSHDGEITILQSELETLELLARQQFGRSDIMLLNLNIVVVYGNPLKGDAMITDRLFNVQFTESPKEVSQGDKNLEHTLPFICTDIQYQTI